ncbi:MAG: hypothetical protein [Caudoviricetes sp.]|nr:MAG: hypothetical protein [Caudoviricetes sp.]
MSTSCNKTRYISSPLCTLLNKKNNSLDIENDHIILIKDFYIEKSIWGYYYKGEPVSNMNLYVSENDYDNVKNNFKSKFLYGSTYSCEILSPLLQGDYNNVDLSNMSIGELTSYDININPRYSLSTSNISIFLTLNNKKDLCKLKLKNYNIYNIIKCSDYFY